MLVWKAFYFSINFEWDPCRVQKSWLYIFPFSTLNISCHSFLACRVSAERSAVKHMGFPIYVICCFSLAAFNILSLCLIFVSLSNICLGMFLLGFIMYGTLCTSWSWLTISFPMLEEFSPISASKFFLDPSFFFFWDPYNLNVGALDIVPEVSETILNSFHYFHHFIFQLTDFFFCFRYSAIDSF